MTHKQLHKRWKTDFALGLQSNSPYPPKNEPDGFTGSTVGTIEYDPKGKTIKVEPFPDSKRPKLH